LDDLRQIHPSGLSVLKTLPHRAFAAKKGNFKASFPKGLGGGIGALQGDLKEKKRWASPRANPAIINESFSRKVIGR